jgi:hypothetical protein
LEGVRPQILDEMAAAAKGIGPMLMPLPPISGVTANGWNIPPANVGMPGTDYPGRAVVAVFGLTSNTPTEAIFYTSVMNGAGRPLTGAKRYSLTFKEPAPCIKAVPLGFWRHRLHDSKCDRSVYARQRRQAETQHRRLVHAACAA